MTRQYSGTLTASDVMLIDLYTTKLFYKELNTRLRTTFHRDAAIKLAKLLNAAIASCRQL